MSYPRSQNILAPMFEGPVRIPPENFQLRVRKEINTRDTVNARYIESWNTNTPIQQSRTLQTATATVPNFNRFADAYRIPTNSSSPDGDGAAILSQVPDYNVPLGAADSSIPDEQSPQYAFINLFMKAVDTYDTKNKLYVDGALHDMFKTPTDKKNFLNQSIQAEKSAILGIMKSTYIDPTFSGKSPTDKIRILKSAALDAFCIQRQKNVDAITNRLNKSLDAVQPDSLNSVYQDMSPLSSRQDPRDFRQSVPYDASSPKLAENPYFDRYDPTRDPRNMVRELRSAVYEPKMADTGIQESERIRARTFTNRYTEEKETPIALTQWYDLMRPKIDNPEIVYRNQSATWKLGSPL